jgi:hypothetical protein
MLRPLTALTALATLTGCPTQTVTYSATFGSIQTAIFNVSCSTRSCHGSPSFKAGLNLEEGSAYNDLVGVEPETVSARNRGMKLVDPGNPDNSFLVLKLAGPLQSGDGDLMPMRNTALPAEAVAAVREWISQGAKK